jgi:hypothetical protein
MIFTRARSDSARSVLIQSFSRGFAGLQSGKNRKTAVFSAA